MIITQTDARHAIVECHYGARRARRSYRAWLVEIRTHLDRPIVHTVHGGSGTTRVDALSYLRTMLVASERTEHLGVLDALITAATEEAQAREGVGA